MMYFMHDAKIHGHETRLLKHFVGSDGKQLSKHKQILFVATAQQSEAQRRDRCRGTGALGLVEFVHLVAQKTLAMPIKDRKNFEGTTAGDMIGPVHLPGYEHPCARHVKHSSKPKLYDSGYVACGGVPAGLSAPDEAELASEKTARTMTRRSPTIPRARFFMMNIYTASTSRESMI